MNQAVVNMTAGVKQDCARAPQKLTARRTMVAGSLGPIPSLKPRGHRRSLADMCAHGRSSRRESKP